MQFPVSMLEITTLTYSDASCWIYLLLDNPNAEPGCAQPLHTSVLSSTFSKPPR